MADDSTCAGETTEGWLLTGGEGRRMGGQDKGLLTWHGQPLAWVAASRLAAQVRHLTLNANRHTELYAAWGWPVKADDPDLPPRSGPLAGILTGLRHLDATWLQLAPCDSPLIPANLTATLHLHVVRQAAQGADTNLPQVVVPFTLDTATGQTHHHWTCALVHRSTLPVLEGMFGQGERRVGAWVRETRWIGVCFGRPADFANINTPETLHGTPPA